MNRGIAIHGACSVDMVVSSIQTALSDIDLDFDVIDAFEGAIGAVLELIGKAEQAGDCYRLACIFYTDGEEEQAGDLLTYFYQLHLDREMKVVLLDGTVQEDDPEDSALTSADLSENPIWKQRN